MVQVRGLQPDDPHQCWAVRHLPGLPDEAEARRLLEAVARQVRPLMRRHSFRVPLLSEFFPPHAALLGLNVGGGGGATREIRLRLRPAAARGSFLPLDALLRTMTHELAHNVHGPHDVKFYALWDKLSAELDDLVARGVTGTGAGFDAAPAGRAGARGGAPGLRERDAGPAALRRAAAAAAEARARRGAVMPAGGRVLGGDGALRALPPREAAAAAAERRARDNVWCPTEAVLAGAAAAGGDVDAAVRRVVGGDGGVAGAGGAGQQQEQEDATRAVAAAAAAAAGAPKRRRGAAGQVVVDLTADNDDDDAAPPPPSQRRQSLRSAGGWVCGACTLVNLEGHLACAACGGVRGGA